MDPNASCHREKPASKGYSLCDSIYMTSCKGKSRGTGIRCGCKELRVGGGLTRKRQQEEMGKLMDILDGGGGYRARCSSKPSELYAGEFHCMSIIS